LRSLKELDELASANAGGRSILGPAVRAEMERDGVTPPAERPASRAGWTRYERAFDSYVRTGVEHRDMGEAVGAGGGYLVPTAFSDSCYVGLSYQSALWSKAAIWKSANGAPAQYPAIAASEQGVASGVGAEDTLGTETDVALRQILFGATPFYVAKDLARVGRGLVQDAAFDVQALLAAAFSQRVARATEADLMQTLVTGTTATTTTATAGGLVSTGADVIAWVYSLDLAHRGSSGAAFIVSPNTAKYMRGIVDGNGRPLMLDQPTRTVPMGDEAFGSTQPVQFLSAPTLFGIPVLETEATAISNLGPGNTVGIFANLASAFVIRVASSFEVQVLTG